MNNYKLPNLWISAEKKIKSIEFKHLFYEMELIVRKYIYIICRDFFDRKNINSI